jgi:hypothetical protein
LEAVINGVTYPCNKDLKDDKWHWFCFSYNYGAGSDAKLLVTVDRKIDIHRTITTGKTIDYSVTSPLVFGATGTPALVVKQAHPFIFGSDASSDLPAHAWTVDQSQDYSCPVTAAVKAQYRFNDAATCPDSSGNANNSASVGPGVTFTTDGAAKMDKVAVGSGAGGAKIVLTDASMSLAGASTWSYGGWFYPDTNAERVITELGASRMGLEIVEGTGSQDGEFRWSAWTYDSNAVKLEIKSNAVIAAATWTHVFVVCDTYEITMYVNGVPQRDRALFVMDTINPGGGSGYFLFGDAAGNEFAGKMAWFEYRSDALRPWDVKLRYMNEIVPQNWADSKYSTEFGVSKLWFNYDMAGDSLDLGSSPQVNDKSTLGTNDGVPANTNAADRDEDVPGTR